MQKLELNTKTSSNRNQWSWTNRNIRRAEDILTVTNELKEWWPLTARQIYYRLISKDLIQQDHWKWNGRPVGDIYGAIIRTLKWMRIDEKLSWEAITDEHRTATPKLGFTSVEDFVNYEMNWMFEGYSRCAAQKQKNYIELWIEKAALLHIVKPIADEFCRRVVVCRGYNSVTFQAEFYNRATEAIGYGQTPIVLYFGDWDPSGINMIYAAMQTLGQELNLYGVQYYRAGINPEHFSMIEGEPVDIKESDTRSKRFVEMYGDTAYELDAFHPAELGTLARDAIEEFTDMDIFEQNKGDETGDKEIIGELRNSTIQYVENTALNMGLWQ